MIQNNAATMTRVLDSLTNVTNTMGPNGKLVSIKGYDEVPKLTKDGVTVLNSMSFNDSFAHDAILTYIKEAARKTDSKAGDATTTTTLFVQNMMNYILSSGEDNFSSVFYEQLQEIVKELVEFIRDEYSDQPFDEDMCKLILTSVNNDEKLANVIFKAYLSSYLQNPIIVDDSDPEIEETYLSVYDKGMYFNATGHTHKPINYDKARLVLISGHVRSMTLLTPLLMKAREAKEAGDDTALIIIASDFDPAVLSDLKANRDRNVLDVVAIQAEGFNSNEYDIMRAVSDATGSNIYTTVSTNTSYAHLIKLEDLKIVSGEINQYYSIIHADIDKEIANNYIKLYTKDKSNEEISTAILSKFLPTTIIRIGANTSARAIEVRDRVIDGVGAVEAAFNSGIMIGGGIGFRDAVKQFIDGYRPNQSSIEAQVLAVLDNLSYSIFMNLSRLEGIGTKSSDYKNGDGYNFKTHKRMGKDNIQVYDSTLGVCEALTNSAEVVSNIMNINCFIDGSQANN